MPYSCPVSLLVIEGGTLPDLTGILWQLWDRLGTGTGSGPQQEPREDVVVSSTGPINLTFTHGPDNTDLGGIGLSLQETPGVAGSTGWLFRSGRLATLPLPPPTLDVVICPAVRFSAGPDRTAYGLLSENVTVSDLPQDLLDGATMIRTVTAASVAGGFMLTVAGTSPAAFSHSVTVTLWPSADQKSPTTWVLEWNTVDTGPDTGVVTTAARNFARRIAAEVVSDIVRIVGRVAIQSLAAVVIPAPAPGTGSGLLDPGVVLSIRQVVATANGLAILPALGAFGSVAALQFPERVSAPRSRRCALTSMVTLLELPLNLDAFRAYRDTVLRQTPSGRNAIETYYREAPSALGVISSDPTLLAAVGDLVVRFERDLALDGVLSRKTRQMVEKFVADLEARGPRYLADLARQAFIQYGGAT